MHSLEVNSRLIACPMVVIALSPALLGCRPPPPPPPEPAPPLPAAVVSFAVRPDIVTTGSAAAGQLGTISGLTYRAERGAATTGAFPVLVEGSTPDRRALRLDRGAFTAPLPADLGRGFSVELLVRIEGQGGLLGNGGASNGTLIAVGNGYSDGFRLTADTVRRTLSFSIGRPAPPHAVSLTTPPVPFGQWLHVAATWDGRTMRVYLAGWPVGQRAMTDPYTPPAAPTLRIGYANAGVGSLDMAVERATVFAVPLRPSDSLRLALADGPDTAEFVDAWDAAVRAIERGSLAEATDVLRSVDQTAARSGSGAASVAARWLEAELEIARGRSAAAAAALLEVVADAQSLAFWRTESLERLRRWIREGAASSWPAAVLERASDQLALAPAERTSLMLAQLAAFIEAGKAEKAGELVARLLDMPSAEVQVRSIALLARARLALEAGDLDRMRSDLREVLALKDAPLAHRDEAERLLADPEPGTVRDRLSPLPQWPKPAIELFVAPHGDDANPGTRERPLATPNGARDALRRLRTAGGLPPGGAILWFAPGRYAIRTSVLLDARDSGTPNAPIVWRAADPDRPPEFDGGVRLRPAPLSDSYRALVDPDIADRLIEFDLAAHGLTNPPPLVLGGFASGRGFRTIPTLELFADGGALPRAAWPDDGWVPLVSVHGTNPVLAHGRTTGAVKEGILGYDGDRPARWTNEPALLLHGYWHHRWADSYEHVRAIETAARRIHLEPPWHTYGFRKGGFWRAVNAISEINQPGEWAVLPNAHRIIAMPPAKGATEWVVSACAEPMLRAENLAHVAFLGLVWQYGAHDALRFRAGTNVYIAGCVIRHFAGDAIVFDGGRSNTVRSCDVYSMGRGGIFASGGDRRTLTPGGHLVENCHIHDLSRIHPTYTPAVSLAGVGHRIAHCLVHHVRSSAFRVAGNDHLVEMNEIAHVVTESDDQGGADMWGNPTFRGVRFRHNFWHHIGRRAGETVTADVGRAGIRLDDAICGVVIRGNIFLRCGAGGHNIFGSVQIHGGKENEVDGNVIALAPAAISFTPWAEARWREFITGTLEKPDIDRALFLARYPALANLPENPNRNDIFRNYIWRCEMLGWRSGAAPRWLANQITAEPETPFLAPEHGNFQIKTGHRPPGCFGPDPIPFNAIGLRTDIFRKLLPDALLSDLRAPARKPGGSRSP
ncbi:MAG: hypothetical protein N2652_00205 [Kiritimatiellae bacterium]|nr:hypothetical protein [Kiritimatiellia bacterium]